MPDWLTASLSGSQTNPPALIIWQMGTALILGLAVAGLYRWARRGETVQATFVTTLMLLAAVIAMATQVIGDNVAPAFSMVGALSVVRFRTFVTAGDSHINLDPIRVVTREKGEDGTTRVLIGFAGVSQSLLLRGKDAEAFMAGFVGKPGGDQALKRKVKLEAEASSEPFVLLAYDGFDGKLGLNWKPVRPDPSHVSLKGRSHFCVPSFGSSVSNCMIRTAWPGKRAMISSWPPIASISLRKVLRYISVRRSSLETAACLMCSLIAISSCDRSRATRNWRSVASSAINSAARLAMACCLFFGSLAR